MDEEEMKLHKQYAVKFVSKKAQGNVVAIEHKIDVNTMQTSPAESLALNEIALCDLSFDIPVIFDKYEDNRITGAFIIIDRITNGTVGAGMIVSDLDLVGFDTSVSTDGLKQEIHSQLEAITSKLDKANESQLIALYKALKDAL
jgi:sulfate adenylyltransferase subunit 1 (EFTu-like GTPase family)